MSSESVKMLQYRAALEEKLKQKAGFAAPENVNGKKQKLTKLAGYILFCKLVTPFFLSS